MKNNGRLFTIGGLLLIMGSCIFAIIGSDQKYNALYLAFGIGGAVVGIGLIMRGVRKQKPTDVTDMTAKTMGETEPVTTSSSISVTLISLLVGTGVAVLLSFITIPASRWGLGMLASLLDIFSEGQQMIWIFCGPPIGIILAFYIGISVVRPLIVKLLSKTD